jgi:hypothetical protein
VLLCVRLHRGLRELPGKPGDNHQGEVSDHHIPYNTFKVQISGYPIK